MEEEHHAIMFLYKVDRQKYGKLIEQMENDVLQKKDPFPKTVNDACRILAGWKNRYGNRENKFTYANDGIAFTTTGEEKKVTTKRSTSHVYKCGNSGHYSNECDEEQTIKTSNKNGSGFLVLNH